jgi:adenylate cyclase
MDLVTQRVHEHGGIVVDYQGDGFLAMWNAPVEQPDHAHRACRAAIAIQRDLPELSRRWAQAIGGEVGMGIGINTGSVIVGNTGSNLKRKYGPLGHPVNLASRVEGATKFFCVPVLLTGATREQLGESFQVRRLCRAHVVGVGEAVQLYELFTCHPDAEWCRRRDEYERGLAHFEAGDWTAACRTIHPLLEGQGPPYDIPSLNLIERAVQCLKSPPRDPFDPTFELTWK